MINIKDNGGHGCSFATALTKLDAMLRAPTSGHQRAFHTRKQLAYCQHAQVGAADVFEYPVQIKYRRTSTGHKPVPPVVSTLH